MDTASVELIERHLRALTENIGVRLAGSANERRAADYLARTFRDHGASPEIEEFPVWERAVEEERLEVNIDGEWRSFSCSLFGLSPGTDGKTLAGELCFFEAATDYRRRDLSYLNGKAVVHLGCHIENAESYRRLMEAGPAFLLFVDVRYPGAEALADTLFPAYAAKFGAKPTVNVAYMDAWNWKNRGAAAARLFAKGGPRRSVSQNVVADIPGTDPDAGTIFVGGHHDTQAGSVGADDNAVGSIALLELARIFSGRKSRRTLRLISFGAEEQLSVGSSVYVRKHRAEVSRDGRFMFNFDSYGSLMGWTEINYNGDGAIENALRACFERRDIYPRFLSEVIPYTDQFAFAAAGVPGLWIWRRNCEAGRFFHHRRDDAIDILSLELVARHIDAAAEFLANIADAPVLPFDKAIPAGQAEKIARQWETLFGGWTGL